MSFCSVWLIPKNINELKNVIFYLKSQKKKVLIRTGTCGQGDKTKLTSSNYVISLENFNKIKIINKKRKTANIEAGANLYKIFNLILWNLLNSNNKSILKSEWCFKTGNLFTNASNRVILKPSYHSDGNIKNFAWDIFSEISVFGINPFNSINDTISANPFASFC